MVSLESASAALTVEDIAALDDTELAEFIKKHRCPNGDYVLPVDDWDKLSKDARNQLAERLKAQQRALAQSPKACSRPLDLDELDARLRDASNSDASSRISSPNARRSRSPTVDIDFEAESREREKEAYHNLVNDGGRPLYTIDLLEQVLGNPDEHLEMIAPWRYRYRGEIWETYWSGGINPWELFQRQLRRWEDFRKWQNDNRGLEDDDGGFLAYTDIYMDARKRLLRSDFYPKWLSKIEADPSPIRSAWEDIQWRREEQRFICREHGCDNFSDYAAAVKLRLARHGFNQPFHLHEDPRQQDNLTTWIEYLNYEYWWLNRYAKSIERLKPAHDKAWQELVDSKVLRPYETQEFLRTDASPIERQAEKDQARRDLERAKSDGMKVYMTTQKDPQRLRIPKAKRISMIEAATERINAARDRLESLTRRSNLISNYIRGTFDYVGAKKDTISQGMLAQWVLEQVRELTQFEPDKAGSSTPQGMRKRRLSIDEDDAEESCPKRQRLNRQGLNSRLGSDAAVLAEAGEAHSEPGIVMDQNGAKGSPIRHPPAGRSHRPVETSQTACQALLRSPRTAASQNTPGTALAADTCD